LAARLAAAGRACDPTHGAYPSNLRKNLIRKLYAAAFRKEAAAAWQEERAGRREQRASVEHAPKRQRLTAAPPGGDEPINEAQIEAAIEAAVNLPPLYDAIAPEDAQNCMVPIADFEPSDAADPSFFDFVDAVAVGRHQHRTARGSRGGRMRRHKDVEKSIFCSQRDGKDGNTPQRPHNGP
jgi:hypothetical protein